MTGLIGHTKRAVENERRRCVAFSGDVASSAFCRAVVKNAAMRAILEAQAISAFVADPNRQEPKIHLVRPKDHERHIPRGSAGIRPVSYDQMPGMIRVEKHRVGNAGHYIEHHATANDGRQQWMIFTAEGNRIGHRWGKTEAEAVINGRAFPRHLLTYKNVPDPVAGPSAAIVLDLLAHWVCSGGEGNGS